LAALTATEGAGVDEGIATTADCVVGSVVVLINAGLVQRVGNIGPMGTKACVYNEHCAKNLLIDLVFYSYIGFCFTIISVNGESLFIDVTVFRPVTFKNPIELA
jgi:hypothetical protein